jgi:hypothetical protein
MERWELIDLRDSADAPEDLPRVVIQSEGHLRAELERLRDRDPAILALEGPIAQGLQFGLGGAYAGIRWGEHPVSNRTGTVLADRVYSEHRIDFASEESTIAFWQDELIPVERAIEVIVSFYKTQRLPSWIAWKEWDPVRNVWEVKPSTEARSA